MDTIVDVGSFIDLMTYDDFVAIELLNVQDENTILKMDKISNVIIIEYCSKYSYNYSKRIMLIVKKYNDIDVKIKKIIHTDTNYSVACFDDTKRRMSNIQTLLVRNPYDIPPNLSKLKKLIDKEVMEKDYQSMDLIENKKEFERAEKICDEYIYYHIMYNSKLAFYYFIHNKALIYVIDGIDKYRGCSKEQKILVDVIRFRVECGKKCILRLWDLDSGFEELSSGLMDLIEDGKVEIHYYNYMKLGLSYVN